MTAQRETRRMEIVQAALQDMIAQGAEVPPDALPPSSTGDHPDLSAHETMGLAAATHSHSGYAGSSHTHGEADVTSLATDLAGKASSSHNHSGTYATSSHTHVEADVTNLGTDLSGKAASGHNHSGTYATSSHSHAESDVTSLTTDLSGKASSTHNHDSDYEPLGSGGGSLPSGLIVMWGGLLADIPSGWNLCDGTNGTPDLREQFIKGSAAGVDPGATGGAATHSHTATQPDDHAISAHSGTAVGDHAAGTTGANSGSSVKVGTSASSAAPNAHTHSTPALTHAVTQPSDHSALTHSGVTVGSASSEPAYYTLAFIQKA